MDNNTPKKRPSIMEVLSGEPKKQTKSIESNSTTATINNPNINTDIQQPVIQPAKEIIRERVVVEYRDKPKGCMPNAGCGCGCRTISCGGCLLIILAIAGLAYVVINKPAFIWSEVVSYLNAGSKAPEYKQQDLTSLEESINSQISNIGEVNINLTQDQITTLARDQATQLKDLTVEIKPQKLRIYFYLDKTLPAKPLYGIVDISSAADGKLTITRIGTGLIALPEFVNNAITNTIYSVLNVKTTGGEQTPMAIISSLFDSNNISVKSVELVEGAVKITADIKVDLFQ